MEELFEYDIQEYIPWFEDITTTIPSAFVNYKPVISVRGGGSGQPNIHKRMRMMEMLITSSRQQIPVVTGDAKPPARERSHRHMLSERMRRERQKQCYFTLHSLLPRGTKSDKNSIIQTAMKKIEQLERMKMDLERENKEIEEGVLSKRKCEVARFKLEVSHPSQAIDSILEVFKCIKETGSEIKAIQSTISTHQLSANLQIHTKIEEAEKVEMAVQRTLSEAGRKFTCRFSPVEYIF